MKKLFAFLLLMLFVAAEGAAGQPDRKELRSLFDSLDANINGGDGYSKSNNAAGTLAWAESYLLEAYLDMYEGTGDNAYITKFVRQARRVARNTDRARGEKDYTGRSRYGWSSTRYGKKDEPVVFIVHTGMILFPMVRFVEMVKNDPSLSRYEDTARDFLELAENAVAECNDAWRPDPRSGGGSYWFSTDEREYALSPMALNGSLSLGRAIVVLYRVTGKEAYLEKATGLAKYFKAGLRQTSGGGYIWGYTRDQDKDKRARMEDISHGAIDVDFAYQAFRTGIVFTREDMQRFSRSLIQTREGKLFHVYLDRTSGKEDRAGTSDSVGRWLELASTSCDIYDAVYDYMSSRVTGDRKEHPAILLGVAKLVKYYDRCVPAGKAR